MIFQNGRKIFDHFLLRTHDFYKTGLGDFPVIIKQQLKQIEDDCITLDTLRVPIKLPSQLKICLKASKKKFGFLLMKIILPKR